MNVSTPAQELAAHGSCLFPTVGDSMRPLLKTGETLAAVQKLTTPPNKYDVLLYHRPNGQYVLHRVIKRTPDGCVTCGDARRTPEQVPLAWAVGVMTGYYRGECFCSCDSLRYRLFVHLWWDTPVVRGCYLLLHRRRKP